jgi:hypothetical protein
MNQTILHNTIRSEEQTPITVTDSSSIDFTVSGVNNHTITADIKRDTVSNGGNNILINTVNGVYVPPASATETPLVANDSSSINFTTSGTNSHTITGVVKRDTVTGSGNNILQIGANGVYVPPPSASIGTDKSIDFAIILSGIIGGSNNFATAGLFPACGGTPTYSLQWYDPNAFTISINSSTGVLTYEFYPYNYLSNNSIVIERNCGGVIDIIRLNYTVDYSLVQALNTYFEEGNRTPSSYALTINSVTPQYLQFTISTGNGNMFTNISGNTLLRFDGIASITDIVGIMFEAHLSGNVSVPDDEDFTIRLVQNGAPVADKVMINSWRSKHSFAKHYIITLNPTDTIGFDVLHSNLISPGNISTTFSDVCILLKPIGYSQ